MKIIDSIICGIHTTTVPPKVKNIAIANKILWNYYQNIILSQ